MDVSFTSCSENELAEIVDCLIKSSNKQRNVILLLGELGAGKTSLVKAFSSKLIDQSADSPTFSLVNEYRNYGKTIYHFDLYRLESIEEIEDIGFWDYLESGQLCIIEWPEKIAELLPENQCIRVRIKLNSNRCREYSVSY